MGSHLNNAQEKRVYEEKRISNNATCLNFSGHCFKDCRNRGKKCDECIRFSILIETKSK